MRKMNSKYFILAGIAIAAYLIFKNKNQASYIVNTSGTQARQAQNPLDYISSAVYNTAQAVTRTVVPGRIVQRNSVVNPNGNLNTYQIAMNSYRNTATNALNPEPILPSGVSSRRNAPSPVAITTYSMAYNRNPI